MRKTLLALIAFIARILPARVRQSVYRVQTLAGFTRRFLNRIAPQGLTTVKVAAGELAGFTLKLDLHCEKDYWLGTYETDLQSVLHHQIRPGMISYDVGANIGYISLMLARLVGDEGKVFSFEALPTNVLRLQQNLALNQMDKRVTCVQSAVTDKTGSVEFLVHGSTSMGKAAGSAGRSDENYPDRLTVQGICLDDFVFSHLNPAPNVIKMDIEGGEVLAIRGMSRLLAEHHPLMLIELHGPEAAHAVAKALWNHDYKLFNLSSRHTLIKSIDDLDWKAYIIGL